MWRHSIERLHAVAGRVGRLLPEPVTVRPPTESDAVRIRATRGCAWNRCRYCNLYRDAVATPRALQDVLDDLDLAEVLAPPRPPGVFYGDADFLALEPREAVAIVEATARRFPDLPRQSTYVIPCAATRWSSADLGALRAAGLSRLYAGLETNASQLHALVERPGTAEEDRAGLVRLQAAGFELWVSVMLGLGGRDYSGAHIEATLDCLNAVAPQVVRIRTLACGDQQPLTAPIQEDGRLELAWAGAPPSPLQEALGTLDELRAVIRGLTCRTTLWCDHASNFVPHVSGTLPEHRDALLEAVDAAEAHHRAQKRPVPIRLLF